MPTCEHCGKAARYREQTHRRRHFCGRACQEAMFAADMAAKAAAPAATTATATAAPTKTAPVGALLGDASGNALLRLGDGSALRVPVAALKRSRTLRHIYEDVDNDEETAPGGIDLFATAGYSDDLLRLVFDDLLRNYPLAREKNAIDADTRVALGPRSSEAKMQQQALVARMKTLDDEMLVEVQTAANFLEIPHLDKAAVRALADIFGNPDVSLDDLRRRFEIVDDFTDAQRAQVALESTWPEVYMEALVD